MVADYELKEIEYFWTKDVKYFTLHDFVKDNSNFIPCIQNIFFSFEFYFKQHSENNLIMFFHNRKIPLDVKLKQDSKWGEKTRTQLNTHKITKINHFLNIKV
jgi:hypothetical protein